MRSILSTAAIVFCCTCLCAADDIGPAPMSGLGDAMRDAERRVAVPTQPVKKGSVPATVADEKTPTGLSPEIAGKVVGRIAAIKVFGSKEFAEREEVPAKILSALGEEGDKTVGQLLAAIEKVRMELIRKGCYLVRISFAKTNTYDKATKTLSLLVDEGRFGKVNVKFEGEDDGFWFSKRQIAKRFKDIEEGDTFDYTRLRRALFDANSHPDLTIDTAIDVRKPIEGDGNDRRVSRYADLNLNVHESVPFHAVWEVNNYGQEDVNEWQTLLTLQYLNLTRHDDVLTFSPAMSLGAELVSAAASYMLPHDYWFGGNTTLYGGWSKVQVDEIIPTLDLEGTGYFVGLQHSENLYNTDRHLLALSFGVLWRYIEDQYTVATKALKERGAHILPLTAALSYTGRKADLFGGRNFATVQTVFNVMNGGDDLGKMWNGAEDDYWIFRGQIARLQPLFGWNSDISDETLHNWQLFTRVEFQYTDQTVIPTEKLMLGGYNCLRGYRTRGYSGDYGIYGTVELRTPLLVDSFASLFGSREDKVAFDRLQLLAFCDWGVVKYNDLPAGYEDNKFLCSAGVGMRLAITQYSQFRCDIAFPCRDGNNGKDRNMEVYGGVQLQF